MPRDSFAVFAYTRTDKSQYAPATLASDISRILDPTYAYGAPLTTTTTTTTYAATGPLSGYTQAKVYVDHAGDMHDPDFRDFPALPMTSRRASTHRRRASSPMRGYGGYGRPTWEGYASDGDEEGDEQAQPASVMTFVSQTRSRSGSASTMNSLTVPEPINFYHRPSFEEEVVFEDDAVEAEAPIVPAKEDEDAKTCSESLRYQIQAIRLNLRLKVVRAQRRWRERRNSDALRG